MQDRELVAYQPQVNFELLNFMELIGEAMGIDIPDLYKRLRLMGDIDQIIADTSDLIAARVARPAYLDTPGPTVTSRFIAR